MKRMLICAAMALMISGDARAIETNSLRNRLSGISMPFFENSGQVDMRVAYYAATHDGTCFVTLDGAIVYSLPTSRTLEPDAGAARGWVLTEIPMGVLAAVTAGEEATAGVSVFHGGDAKSWQSQVRAVREVSLGERWPGVALTLRAHGNSVEKVFTVQPRGIAGAIEMRIDGSECIRVSDSGSLLVETGLGEVRLTSPVAYQETSSGRQSVEVAYRLISEDGYGFSVGPHDPALPLVIDPLVQATYLGGSSTDGAWALSVHPMNGDVYVSGYTCSADFPGTIGGAQSTLVGSARDMFVARFNPGLTALVQATFIDGSSTDMAYAMATHAGTGDVYVAGSTTSSDFPGASGGAQPLFGGSVDGVVVRLDAGLRSLIQSTYLGAASEDSAWSIAVHPTNGDLYVAGTTFSIGFPGSAGGAQSTLGGGVDAYVVRLNPSLTSIIQATYVGGTSQDYGSCLAMHPMSGDIYVSGYTMSADLPGTGGAAQTSLGGGADGFVTRLSPSLTSTEQVADLASRRYRA